MSRKRKRLFLKPQQFLNAPMNNSEEKFLLRLPRYIKNPRKRSIKSSFKLINFFGWNHSRERNIETSLTTFKVSPAREWVKCFFGENIVGDSNYTTRIKNRRERNLNSADAIIDLTLFLRSMKKLQVAAIYNWRGKVKHVHQRMKEETFLRVSVRRSHESRFSGSRQKSRTQTKIEFCVLC